MKFSIEIDCSGSAFEISESGEWGAGFAGELAHTLEKARQAIINGLSESAGHNFTRCILDSNGNRCGALRATLRESRSESGSLSNQARATVADLQSLLVSDLCERISKLGRDLGEIENLNLDHELSSSLAKIAKLSSSLGSLGICELANLAGSALRRADSSSADVLRAVRRSARDSRS